MCEDPLLRIEENRKEHSQGHCNNEPSYHAEIIFKNIKSISYVQLPADRRFSEDPDIVNLRLVLQLNLPCVCYKRYFNQKGRPSRVRSPFNMLESEKAWEGNEFLNYWNLNQTFLIEGQATFSMFFKFLNSVKLHNPCCKITADQLKIKSIANNEIKSQIKMLAAHSLRFSALFNQLSLQLRYAIMSLLSNSKVSLFNESLLGLMKVLIDQGWSSKQQTSDYGSLLVDNMQFYLDPVQRPYEDLIAVFSKQNNQDNLQDYQE